MVLLEGKAGDFTVLLCVLHIYDASDRFSFYEHSFILHNSNIRTLCFIKFNSIRRFQTSLAMSSLSKPR